MPTPTSTCRKIQWKGRAAYCLANDLIELTALTGGGSIAALRLLSRSSQPGENILWEAPWTTLDPDRYDERRHKKPYGPHFVGKFLAGFTGHALCLDCFGPPSDEEIRQGLCLHGEAGVSRWKTKATSVSSQQVSLKMSVKAPPSGLEFERQLALRKGEPVVYVNESVRNPSAADHYFHWTQHVTFGPPFLDPQHSTIALSAERGITWPLGYEGNSLLQNSREFRWPNAPAEGGGTADLSRPFAVAGKGFVAAVLTKTENAAAYLAVLNRKLGLVAGYCFRRERFPWIAVWEENCSRQGAPWNGKTQARGLEFGTTPMPLGKEASFRSGPLFDTPTYCRVPAKSKINAGYVAFLARVEQGWQEIRDVEIADQAIVIRGDAGRQVKVPAHKLKQAIV